MVEKAFSEQLESLVTAIDLAVRTAALNAHVGILQEFANIKDLGLEDCTISKKALIPREVLESRKVKMTFNLVLRDNGVSLANGKMPFKCGTPAELTIEWEARHAPEATALVRTKAETIVASTIVASEIKHG